MKCLLLALLTAAALGQTYINRCVKDGAVRFPESNDRYVAESETPAEFDVKYLCSECETPYEGRYIYYRSNVGDRECVSALEQTGFLQIRIIDDYIDRFNEFSAEYDGTEQATCIPPYHGIGGLCLKNDISHCSIRDRTSIRCLQCETGYGLANHGKSCRKCSALCATCSNSYRQCDSCIEGFRAAMNSFKCLKCSVAHCASCELDIDFCDVDGCKEGYGVSRDLRKCYRCTVSNCEVCEQDHGDKCVVCKEGYRLEDEKCKKCKVSGCGTCHSDAEVCDLCKRDYLLVDQETCTKCIVENCSLCEPGNPYRCRACNKGFQKENGGMACSVCSIDNCLVCDPGNVSRCALCVDFYQVSPSGTCQKIQCEGEFCICPTDSSTCKACEDGYVFVVGETSRCYKRPCNNCVRGVFDGETVLCGECADGYYLKNDGKECGKCDDESGKNKSINCKTCSESKLYEADDKNLIQSTIEPVCEHCLDGFGFDRTYGICIPCVENCQNCDFAARCFRCNAGYDLKPNHTCKRRTSAGANGLVTAFFALLLVAMF